MTLFEAYAYAYDRTVADTAESAAGAQHPTFSYDLAGNGDLVLTDVAVRHEGVYLPREAPGGVYFLVDGKGFVAAEISKADGVDRRVALAPGHYRVKRRLADRLRVGEIDVPRGQLVALEEARLRDAPFSDDPVKGAGRVDLTSRWSLGAGATYQSVFAAPSGASLFPPTGTAGGRLRRCATSCAGTGCWGSTSRPASADGVVTSVGAPFRFSEVSLASSLTVEWPGRHVTPFVGGRLALLLMGRRFADDAYPGAVLLDAVARPGGRRRVPHHAPHQRGRARPAALPPLQRRRGPLARLLGARRRWCPMTCETHLLRPDRCVAAARRPRPAVAATTRTRISSS